MKRIRVFSACVVLIMSYGLGVKADSESISRDRAISIHSVTKKPTSATTDYRLQEAGEVFHVVQSPILTSLDFKDARVKDEGGRTLLLLSLTQSGASKAQSFTRSHQGEKLAFFLGNHLLSTPVIRDPIKGGKLQIDSLDRDQATEIARLLQERTTN